MGLAAVTSHPSYMPVVGFSVGALVVLEMFARFRLIPQGSPPCLTESRVEWVTGGALLCLTAFFTYRHSPTGLATIALITLRRLYGDYRIIPCFNKFVNGSRIFSNQWIDGCYWGVECVATGVLAANFFVYSSQNPVVTQPIVFFAMGFICCPMLFDLEGKIFKIVVRSGYFDQASSIDMTARKVERVKSFFVSLWAIAAAVILSDMFGTVRSIHLRLGLSFKVFVTVQIGLLGIPMVALVARQLVVIPQYALKLNSSINFKLLLPSEEATKTAHRCFLELAYGMGYSERNLERECAIADLLYSAAHTETEKIQTAFKICTFILPPPELEKLITRFPNSLTPDFLSLQRCLWEVFNQSQIERFLLTPELKGVLKGSLDTVSAQLTKLSSQVAEEETARKNGGDVYPSSRPLYEQLEPFKFDKMLQNLKCLPPDATGELISRLRAHKIKIEGLKAQVQDLEERLEHLVGDLFKYAVEGLAALTVNDIKVILEEWNADPSDPLVKITEILANRGIKWKGDLIQKGILQQEDKPDNSKEALKARLTDFIFH